MIRISADKRMLEYGLSQSYPNICCFSTTRHGGFSRGRYGSFNCNAYCGDESVLVDRNRRLLCSLLKTDRLIIPHQNHGTEVRVVDRSFMECSESRQAGMLEGIDALVTNLPGVCICVSTADCIPVLCYDVRRQVVAAVHAGWRGTVARIVERTLRVMNERFGSVGEDIVACIGPGISLETFEVGDEVYESFRKAGFPMSLISRRYAKWHLDLWEANRLQLLDNGVLPGRIELAGICTYQCPDDFFSARRLGIRSGRILSGIMLIAP